jgi:hypothetical protein
VGWGWGPDFPGVLVEWDVQLGSQEMEVLS